MSVADLIITGEQCSYCGVEFQEAHDFPVACKSCHCKDDDLPKATIKEIDYEQTSKKKET